MRAVAKKKFGDQPAFERKEMAKTGRFLSSRGFASWMINDYLFRDPV
jgi:SOS response regulatory protein OraA/RecX